MHPLLIIHSLGQASCRDDDEDDVRSVLQHKAGPWRKETQLDTSKPQAVPESILVKNKLFTTWEFPHRILHDDDDDRRH